MRIALLLILITGFVAGQAVAQNTQSIESQIPKEKKYTQEEVIDGDMGITRYNRLIFRLGGDSSRLCKDYQCSGWVEDYYENGQALHKGYYEQGFLRVFKNFYANGNKERDFKIIDDNKSSLKVYYENGNIKSEITYYRTEPKEWTDYNPDGTIAYQEINDVRDGHMVYQKMCDDKGRLESEMKLEDKKEKIFDHKIYYSTGAVKEAGKTQYVDSMMDYIKIGTWQIYNPLGEVVKEQTYSFGKLTEDKEIKKQ